MVIVVLAVPCGSAAGAYFPKGRKYISLGGQAAGVLLMAVGALANSTSSDPLWENEIAWFVAVTSPVGGGLLAAILLARLVRMLGIVRN